MLPTAFRIKSSNSPGATMALHLWPIVPSDFMTAVAQDPLAMLYFRSSDRPHFSGLKGYAVNDPPAWMACGQFFLILLALAQNVNSSENSSKPSPASKQARLI